MFIGLIKLLLASVGSNTTNMAARLNYNSQAAFYRVVAGKDIRLTVLLAICKACNCDIIITNHSTININLADYVAEQSKTE